MPQSPVFRFAPSPNGPLHLGNVYSALLNAELAARLGGRLLLRIEDIDLARSRPEHIQQMLDDLTWLGLRWEQPVRRQSEHFAEYSAAAARLKARGLLYPCFASRAEIEAAAGPGAARDPDGALVYPGLWRNAGSERVARKTMTGEPFALRLDMAGALAQVGGPLRWQSFDAADPAVLHTVEADPARWGDAVIVRKETPASYHLAVVHDDAMQGITHVVRGADLAAASDLHRLLQALQGLPPPLYHHHRLLARTDGRKLSKSLGDTSIAQLRREGATPARIRELVGL